MPITSLDQVLESRVTWPDHKPRTAYRRKSAFSSEVGRATREIEEELLRWGVKQFVISRNNQRIFAGDPGAAVWWNAKPKTPGGPPELRVLACDKWTTLADNLHAIALTLSAMRALERWGAYTAEQAAEGARAALPPPASTEPPEKPWWEVLGVGSTWPLEAIEIVYRMKAEKAHPDRGGSAEEMAALNAAIAAARKELVGPR